MIVLAKAVTLAFLVLCVRSDLRTLRIPNAYTGPAILVGIALGGLAAGWTGVANSLTGCALAIGLLFIPFALGGVGAGDVKMMGAVGALLGPNLVLESLVFGLALGGVFAVGKLVRLSRFRETVVGTGRMFGNAVLAWSVDPLRVSAADPNAVVLPYSLPLGLGTASVIAISLIGTS